jgi:hypothetical protein
MKVWPIGTPKNPKTRIIKGDRKKFVDESVIGKKFGGGAIDEIYNSEKSLIPVLQWHGGMGKKS